MFVQQKRRMCYHQEMAPSYHFPMSWQMSPLWTKIQWKHCWSFQRPTIRCLLERSYCWMYRLSRKLKIQPERKCLSLPRKIPHWAKPQIRSNFISIKRTKKKTILFLIYRLINWIYKTENYILSLTSIYNIEILLHTVKFLFFIYS